MNYDFDRGSHSVYSLYYSLIFVVKYRRKVISPKIDDFIKHKVRVILDTFDVNILIIESDKDHIHILFKAIPKLDIPRYINALKAITSRKVEKIPRSEEKTMGRGILDSFSCHFWTGNFRCIKKIC